VRLALVDESFDVLPPELRALHEKGDPVLLIADPTSAHSVAEAVDQARRQLGGIDVLVNATFEDDTSEGIWELGEEALRRAVQVNMKCPFFAMQACVPYMRERGGGRVVNLSSTRSAVTDGHSHLALGITKAGLNSMTRQWAVDLSPDNIQANSLWGSDTPDHEPRTKRAGDHDSDGGTSGRPRGGHAGEVGRLVAYLALDATQHINGTQITVDGGETALAQGSLVLTN
jgi:NAD(P)-dependent dehydrogenase (short-subunit alcohol dehydrogenase family)